MESGEFMREGLPPTISTAFSNPPCFFLSISKPVPIVFSNPPNPLQRLFFTDAENADFKFNTLATSIVSGPLSQLGNGTNCCHTVKWCVELLAKLGVVSMSFFRGSNSRLVNTMDGDQGVFGLPFLIFQCSIFTPSVRMP